MVQIVTTPDEMNASIITSVLENEGIQASYAHNITRYGRIASCVVYCIEEKKEEALKLLRERELIDKK